MTNERRTILFLTNSEHGQSNVALAVIQELIILNQYNVHIGSFEALRSRLEVINQAVPVPQQAKFHLIRAPSLTEVLNRSNGSLPHPPGISGVIQSFDNVNASILGWTPPEYIEAYGSCLEIINDVKPNVIVVDPLFHFAIDACNTSNIPTVILWATCLKDVVITVQPYLAMMWKFPLVGSGYPFPLPWHLILPNIYLVIRFVSAIGFGSALRGITNARKELGLKHPFPLEQPCPPKFLHLTPSLPELDFPLHIPSNVLCCGPILFPANPTSTSDPELTAWLSGPTMLINLGSAFAPESEDVQEMMKGIEIFLSQSTYMRVLWKLKTEAGRSQLRSDLQQDNSITERLKIVDWIKPEIVSLLESGQIVGFVHHGGGNSFFEACKYGIPQVILPTWLDTYDNANRVEWLGIGVYGSRETAPHINGTKFSQALIQVTTDEGIKNRAKAIQQKCLTTVGRTKARDAIIQLARGE